MARGGPGMPLLPDSSRRRKWENCFVPPMRQYFPFIHGAEIWNTSIQAAVAQGTFVLTTSKEKHGYDEQANIYYAVPGNYEEMRIALDKHIGRRNPNPPRYDWEEIASAHLDLYKNILI